MTSDHTHNNLSNKADTARLTAASVLYGLKNFVQEVLPSSNLVERIESLMPDVTSEEIRFIERGYLLSEPRVFYPREDLNEKAIPTRLSSPFSLGTTNVYEIKLCTAQSCIPSPFRHPVGERERAIESISLLLNECLDSLTELFGNCSSLCEWCAVGDEILHRATGLIPASIINAPQTQEGTEAKAGACKVSLYDRCKIASAYAVCIYLNYLDNPKNSNSNSNSEAIFFLRGSIQSKGLLSSPIFAASGCADSGCADLGCAALPGHAGRLAGEEALHELGVPPQLLLSWTGNTFLLLLPCTQEIDANLKLVNKKIEEKIKASVLMNVNQDVWCTTVKEYEELSNIKSGNKEAFCIFDELKRKSLVASYQPYDILHEDCFVNYQEESSFNSEDANTQKAKFKENSNLLFGIVRTVKNNSELLNERAGQGIAEWCTEARLRRLFFEEGVKNSISNYEINGSINLLHLSSDECLIIGKPLLVLSIIDSLSHLYSAWIGSEDKRESFESFGLPIRVPMSCNPSFYLQLANLEQAISSDIFGVVAELNSLISAESISEKELLVLSDVAKFAYEEGMIEKKGTENFNERDREVLRWRSKLGQACQMFPSVKSVAVKLVDFIERGVDRKALAYTFLWALDEKRQQHEYAGSEAK
jgi:hypothetical protein